MRNLCTGLVMAAALTVGTSMSAQAAPVVFNFGGGSNTLNTINLSESGVDLTVKGFGSFVEGTFTGGGGLGTPQNINRNNLGNGWGVNLGGSGLIDVGDALNLDFTTGSVLLLSSIVFELDGVADSFALFNGTTKVGVFNIPASPGADEATFDLSILLSSAEATGSNFTIATESGAIRLKSLTVDPDVSNVPLPAALTFMATGLGILGAFAGLRRRRDGTRSQEEAIG